MKKHRIFFFVFLMFSLVLFIVFIISSRTKNDSGITDEILADKFLTDEILTHEDLPPEPTVPTWQEAFAVILNAYREFDQSDFAYFDEELIGHSEYAIELHYNFHRDGSGSRPFLQYALYDINGNGIPELFINMNWSISGIYTFTDGRAVSLIQTCWREALGLSTDTSGRYVVTHRGGRMSYAHETIYTLNENGELTEIDSLLTRGHNGEVSECGNYINNVWYNRVRNINGEYHPISEEEYNALLYKYGTSGYMTATDASAIRSVTLTWNPISTNLSPWVQSWVGTYSFFEAVQGISPVQMLEQTIEIYVDEGRVYALITRVGCQTYCRMIASVVRWGENRIWFSYHARHLSDEGIVTPESPDANGMLLLFTRNDGELITTWRRFQPMLEENKEEGVYFVQTSHEMREAIPVKYFPLRPSG
jgi:hypothetical protein